MSDRRKKFYYGRCEATGKIKYLSKKAAKITLRRMLSNITGDKNDSVKHLGVYKCPSCETHHIGTQTVHGKKVSRKQHNEIFKRTHK